jgi:hypothetical protein
MNSTDWKSVTKKFGGRFVATVDVEHTHTEAYVSCGGVSVPMQCLDAGDSCWASSEESNLIDVIYDAGLAADIVSWAYKQGW